jgi:hypothetical protein
MTELSETTTNEKIEQSLLLLSTVSNDPERPPAMVVMPPDSGKFIIGNREGFVQLAIAALKAAQGGTLPFEKEPWCAEDEMDWGVRGLKFDEYAHMHLPEKATPLQKTGRTIFGYFMVISIASIFVTGWVTACHWLYKLAGWR